MHKLSRASGFVFYGALVFVFAGVPAVYLGFGPWLMGLSGTIVAAGLIGLCVDETVERWTKWAVGELVAESREQFLLKRDGKLRS